MFINSIFALFMLVFLLPKFEPKDKNQIINCHGAYLPHNRGAHPNVWSFIDNTPKGGTIQYINENVRHPLIQCIRAYTTIYSPYNYTHCPTTSTTTRHGHR